VELRDLGYLVACVDAGSFTKAARRLHVAQPTLSHAVKRLEDEVGRSLLERPRARDGVVVPTEAGALLVARTRSIAASLDAYRDEVAALEGVLRGTVTLGAAPSLAMSFVPAVLERMLAAWPLVRMGVETAGSEALMERVRDRSLDAALVADIPTRVAAPTSRQRQQQQRTRVDPRLVFVGLFEEDFVVVAGGELPLGGRVRLKEIAKRPLLLPAENVLHGQRLREAFEAAGCGAVVPRATLGSAEALLAAARRGVGYALLPERCVHHADPQLRRARITDVRVSRSVRLVLHRESANRKLLKALRDAALEATATLA
jgi:DNA-binding transcriptional LysR family regulator